MKDGEICSKERGYLNADAIQREERYDGFYAVCTSLDCMGVDGIVRINMKRWEILSTLKDMVMSRPG